MKKFLLCVLSVSCVLQANDDAEKKVAVLMVTSGRSGSSCLAGVLNILGLPMGDQFAAPDTINPKGFFEHKPSAVFINKILRQLKWDPSNPGFIDWERDRRCASIKNQIKLFVRQHFGHEKVFGIKVPQISLLMLPFLQAVEELGYQPKVLVITRHPEENARSWGKMLKQDPEKMYKIMCNYLVPILVYGTRYPIMSVYFDDLIEKTERVANELYRFIPGLRMYQEVRMQLDDFIDSGLKHHNVTQK